MAVTIGEGTGGGGLGTTSNVYIYIHIRNQYVAILAQGVSDTVVPKLKIACICVYATFGALGTDPVRTFLAYGAGPFLSAR